MPKNTVSRDRLLVRAHAELMKEARQIAGKGGVASKKELEKVDGRSLLKDAEYQLRRDAGAKVIRLEPWVDAAAQKLIGALDAVDKKGRGHGTISLAEAREAAAARGDAGQRIRRAYEVLTGASLEPKGEASPARIAAAEAYLASQTFDAIAAPKDFEPTAWVRDRIEKKMEELGGESLNAIGRFTLDGQPALIASSSRFDRELVEHLAVFDTEGRPLARAQITRDDDTYALTLKAVPLAGGAGTVIATSASSGHALPQAWVDALKADLDTKYGNGDDLGTRIRGSELPAALQPIYQFLVRNTPDGTGVEKIDFDGRTAYAIHLYECVSSATIWSEDGTKLADFTG